MVEFKKQFLLTLQTKTHVHTSAFDISTFIISTNFQIRQIWRWWFQIWRYCFQISPQNYPNKALLVRNLFIFIFQQNVTIWQIWRYSFQIYDKRCFKLLIQKYPNKAFLLPNLAVFIPKFRHFHYFRTFSN